MSKAIKKMLYIIELKKGFRKVGEMKIEVDPYSLDKYFFDDSERIEEVVENCDAEMFEIEQAINAHCEIRAHLKRITNIEEVKSMAEDKVKVMKYEETPWKVNPPSKEGKKHHDKLDKKWKKMEKKHS